MSRLWWAAALLALGVAMPISARADPFPDCGAPYNKDGSARTCTIRSNDSAQFQVVANLSGRTKGSVVYPKTEIRLITSPSSVRVLYSGSAAGPPHWADIDHDGHDELLLPESVDSAGTRWRVWHDVGDADHPDLAESGDLFGNTLSFTDDGYVADLSSASGHGEAGFHRFEAGHLRDFARVDWTGSPGDGFMCDLARRPDGTLIGTDLDALGMDEQQASEHFCAAASTLLR